MKWGFEHRLLFGSQDGLVGREGVRGGGRTEGGGRRTEGEGVGKGRRD